MKTIAVNILHVFKTHELIDGNEFLRKVLKETSAGSWIIDTEDREHVREIERLFTAKRIKFKIKEI